VAFFVVAAHQGDADARLAEFAQDAHGTRAVRTLVHEVAHADDVVVVSDSDGRQERLEFEAHPVDVADDHRASHSGSPSGYGYTGGVRGRTPHPSDFDDADVLGTVVEPDAHLLDVLPAVLVDVPEQVGADPVGPVRECGRERGDPAPVTERP
jgi:hypothetical protein